MMRIFLQPKTAATAVFFSILVAFTSFSHASPANQEQVEQKAAELEKLKQKIDDLRKSFLESQADLNAEDKRLKDIDLEIDNINVKLRDLAAQQKSLENELAILQSKRQNINDKLQAEQKMLGQHLRAAYISGHEEYLKLIMNQQSPEHVSRMLVYYRYLTADRVSTINRINGYLDDLGELEEKIRLRSSELSTVIEQQQAKRDDLKETYSKQLSIVKKLQLELTGKEEQISRFKRDEKDLLVLIDKLRQAIDELLEEEKFATSFRDYRGRLELPANAKVVKRYGTRRDIGNLRWKGIVLAGKLGSEVRAVFNGRVVYADWMRGFGLLLIVDHGDSYMSLYGHNESLLVEEGDWVETGQVIASMGKSGGNSEPGLYFEIRYRGKPQNPLRWARR
jgi:septal ring factor EnvC (AmiA/AmiB activator)